MRDEARRHYAKASAHDILINGVVDAATLLKEHFPAGGEYRLLEELTPQLVVDARSAHAELRRVFPAPQRIPRRREELSAAGVQMPRGKEWVFAAVAHVGRRPVPSVGVPATVSAIPLVTRQAEREQQERDLQVQRETLVAERALVVAEAARLGRLPRGVLPGIFVLAGFGGVGIVLPLALMASRPLSDSLAVRRIVFFGFVAGFAALLGYILWVAVGLLGDGPEDP
jgi:hypothetical protein